MAEALTRQQLERMLSMAMIQASVHYPGEVFCEVVRAAMRSTERGLSPPLFTARELDGLLAANEGRDIVEFDAREFVALVHLALQSSPD